MTAHWPHGDPTAVVRGILASPAYGRHAVARTRTEAHETWLQTLGDEFHDRIWEPFWHVFHDPIGHAVSSVAYVGGPIGYGVVALACVLLAFAVYRLAIAFGRPLRTAARSNATAGDGAFANRSSSELRERASVAARAGDYGRAIAALFAAALALLDERAVVAFDRTRTPGEYARALRRADPDAARPFGALTGRFVAVAYADRGATADDYAAAVREYAEFDPLAVARNR